MDKRYRVYLAWGGREDDLRDMARQLASFTGALGALHPRLKDLRFIGPSEREVTAAGLEACQSALESRRVDWATGPTRRVAYQPRLFIERRTAPPVEIHLTCGIPRLDLGPIYTPNRLDLWVRSDAGEDLASPAVIEAALRAAVEAFTPDWGFAGTDDSPAPPLPIFSAGVPSVGWMTYLSGRYPPIPAALPTPAVMHVIARRGALVIAHPDLFDDADEAHRGAVERVREALDAAGVLVPAAAFDTPGGAPAPS